MTSQIYTKNEYYHTSKFNLYFSASNIINSGLGIFTNDFIKAGTFIDFYIGEYVEHLIGGEYFFRIDENGGINSINLPRCYMAMLNDASYRPNSKRKLRTFIDHDYKNNCIFKVDVINKKVEIHSLVDIQIGEELFISYGNEYWS